MGVSETIFEAPIGTDAKTLKISSTSQVFYADQDGNIVNPSEIILTAQKQNISSTPKWDIISADPAGNIAILDDQDVPITLNTTQKNVVKITAANMATKNLIQLRAYIDEDNSNSYDSGEFFDTYSVVRVQAGSDS